MAKLIGVLLAIAILIAICSTGSAQNLYLFSKGINDKKIFSNSMDASGKWSGWNGLPGGGTTDVALSATSFG